MTNERRGARTGAGIGALRVESDGGAGWRRWLPLLLALLVLLIAAAILIAVVGDGDDGKDRQATSNRARLTAAETSLLPIPDRGLGPVVGQRARGSAVTVQSVNGNEGFWVGTSPTERVYVEFGGDVGENEPSRFQPQKGERVSLSGPIQRAPAEPERALNLRPADAQLVRVQGGFINADRVRPD